MVRAEEAAAAAPAPVKKPDVGPKRGSQVRDGRLLPCCMPCAAAVADAAASSRRMQLAVA